MKTLGFREKRSPQETQRGTGETPLLTGARYFFGRWPHRPASPGQWRGRAFSCASRFFKERFTALCFRAHPALSFRAERKSWGSPKHKASIDRRSVEAGEPQLRQIYSLRDEDGIPCAWSRSRVMGSTRGTVGKRECSGILTLYKNRKGWATRRHPRGAPFVINREHSSHCHPTSTKPYVCCQRDRISTRARLISAEDISELGPASTAAASRLAASSSCASRMIFATRKSGMPA